MLSQRESVMQFTLRLQTQQQLPLWALANENIIFNAACQEKTKWGRRAIYLVYLMRWANKLGMANWLIFIFGLFRLFRLWAPLNKNQTASTINQICSTVFIGFGAAAEDHLFTSYQQNISASVCKINFSNLEKLTLFGKPSFLYALSVLWRNSMGYTAKLKKCQLIPIHYQVDFLSVMAFNIGMYAFCSAFWRQAKNSGVEQAVFLAPDIASFACIDAVKLKTTLLQHGLLANSILFPKFDRVEVVTQSEKNYLLFFFKENKIEKVVVDLPVEFKRKEHVLVLSPNVFLKDRVKCLAPLIAWLSEKNWLTIIRCTPTVSESCLQALQNIFPNAIFDDLTQPLIQSVQHWAPKLVVSWLSTGLATALDQGFLPISLCDPITNQDLDRMIYPMKQRVLFWPRDKAKIIDAIYSEEIYARELDRLCAIN